MALVYAMLATLIISGVAVVLVSLAMSELRLTARSASWESAIHSAEGGADVVVTAVNEDATFTTGHVYAPASSDPADIEAWAIDEATTNCTLVATGDGEACGIRPVDSAGFPMDVVFGVGFVPSSDNPQATRVVRVEYDRGFLSTTKAILTGGDLTISGSADILGLAGNVHANGSIDISNNAATVSGDVTYSGSTGTSSNSTITPVPAPSEDINEVSARGVYEDQSGNFDKWFDLCADGTVRKASPDGKPCNNPNIEWTNGQTAQYRGWAYKITAGGEVTWSTSGGAPVDGIYYVQHGNAKIGGAGGSSTATMSVLLESSSDDCTSSVQQGHFHLGANLKWRPFLADAMIIADGDLVVNGTAQQDLEGVMMVREQIKVTGGPSMEGALIAEQRCNTPGSPVNQLHSEISGSMNLTHNGNLLVPVSGIVRVIAWNEM